jgi:hypothetical protein
MLHAHAEQVRAGADTPTGSTVKRDRRRGQKRYKIRSIEIEDAVKRGRRHSRKKKEVIVKRHSRKEKEVMA